MAGRTDCWINGKFRSPINSKDEHSVEDCVDPRERKILEFVVPIIYPEKPKQVTRIAIVRAWSEEREAGISYFNI